MNPEFGRQPGDNQPTGQQPWGPGQQGWYPPPAAPQASGQPPMQGQQPGYQQWQPPMPPPGHAPKGRPKWLIPVLALAGALVIAGGVGGGIALFAGSSPTTSAAESQFAQASSPADALIAATNVTLDSTPMVSRMTVAGTEISRTQVDYGRGISYSEQSGGATAGATFYLDNGEMMIRFGEELGLPGVDGNTWYRLDTENPLFSLIGQSIAIATDKDSQREMMDVYSSVEDRGKSTFEGQSLTRLVATVDSQKFIEYSLNLAKEFGGDELGLSDADMRRELRSQVPTTIEYWVDDRGRIIKQVTDDQIVVNGRFGEPLDIPRIPASQIEDFPFN